MQKLIKGSIAGAAGIALLLGGGSTFALWSDADVVNAGKVQTGVLRIDTVGLPAWADISPRRFGDTFDPATNLLVPGDVVTYSQMVAIKASGKNLQAQLSFDPISIGIHPELKGVVSVHLTTTADAASDAQILSDGFQSNSYTIIPGDDTVTALQVVITIAFDPNTTGVGAQNLANGIDLSGLSYTLTQVRP
ncbi:MAG: putative exported protein [Homoserinimonas sp.]|nr:putative exported protein [Homoserinimonas sp.]